MERKELDFIMIDGTYYGGDQNWHTHRMMKLGGCSAVSACETCIYLAKTHPGMRALYPYDPDNVSKEDFLKFFETMFRYVHPGIGGLTSIDKMARMVGQYIDTTGVSVEMRKLSGSEPYEQAEATVREAIQNRLPVMYLMLKHADIAFDEYEWHWFTITGYEETDHGINVDFATWGEKHTFDLKRAWDTKKAWRGGMVAIGPR